MIAYGLPTPETLLNPLEIGNVMETEAYEEGKTYGTQEYSFSL